MSGVNDDLMTVRSRNLRGNYLSVCVRVPKYLVLIAFPFAVYVSLAQFSPYPSLSGLAFKLAYAAFPFLIFSILFAVHSYSWLLIKEAWKNKSWKRLSWTAGIGYTIFYIFVTNTISVPGPGPTVPPDLSHGYIIPFEVYGPMAVWPDVEFYFPSVNVVGYLSVGNVLLFVSLGLLTAFAVSLLIQNVRARRGLNWKAASSFGSAFLAAMSTNALCCGTPVLLPALVFLFGGIMPNAVVVSLVNPQSPVSNLLVIATLASLTASVILSTRGLNGGRL